MRLIWVMIFVAIFVAIFAAGCSTQTSTTTSATTAAQTSTTAEPETYTAIKELDKPAIVIATHPKLEAISPHAYYLAEREGRIWEVSSSARMLLDITEFVRTGSELGLLGMAVSPDGVWFYIMYSNLDGNNVLDAVPFTIDGTLDFANRRTLMVIAQPFSNHNGGDIHFSPTDGYLYISLGDGGSANDPFGHGQNTHTFLGSILRIDPNPERGSYDIPPDNPFVPQNDEAQNGALEVWAYGARNPWRISFDPDTGDLWVADVGQDLIEEISLIPNGGINLGWNYFEGSQAFLNNQIPASVNHHPPIFEYAHSASANSGSNLPDRCSIIGGHLYIGSALKLGRKYLYADYCEAGVIRAYDPQTGEGDIFVAKIADDDPGAIITFGRTSSGETLIGTEKATYLLVVEK